MAPYAPFNGTVSAAVCVDEVKLSVAVSRTPAACVDVNCTLTWQVVGAVCVVKHVLPVIVKSAALAPPAIEKLLSVACPDPVTLTVTVCVLVKGAGVPVGIPNESSPGETETDGAGACGTARDCFEPKPTSSSKRAMNCIMRTVFFREFMAHPFRSTSTLREI